MSMSNHLDMESLADHFGQPVFFKLTEIKKGGRGWQQRA